MFTISAHIPTITHFYSDDATGALPSIHLYKSQSVQTSLERIRITTVHFSSALFSAALLRTRHSMAR